MPKPRLPHLHRESARGKTFWYYRKGHGPRTRLRGSYMGAEFLAAYRAAEAGTPASVRAMRGEGTLEWLWNLYLRSPDWERLAPATKTQRLGLMRPSLERAGRSPVETIERTTIIASCDARAATPGLALNFLNTLRAFFKWAVSRGHVESDPTIGVRVRRVGGDGHHTWTPAEMSAFESRWPVGTRERLAYDLLLWTGLRRSDAVRVGPAHVIDGAIVIRTQKTKADVEIRILPPLAASLAAAPVGKTTFIARMDCKPMNVGTFGAWFRAASRAAGVPGSCHGLRKALAVRLAESGAGPLEIGSILGNALGAFYAKKANKRTLGDAALGRLFPDG